jgi:hypothetical protein
MLVHTNNVCFAITRDIRPPTETPYENRSIGLTRVGRWTVPGGWREAERV